VATDRETTIRRAEKLLKQGKLDAALGEYVRAVEEQPRDWNTANILGDLYVRAGQVESAVSQYARVAAHFAHEGFLQKAAALYRKIAKIRPQDESVLLRLADLSEQQGLIADAKSCLTSVAEHRRRRGNRKGAAEIVLRLARLDPTDLSVSLLAARAAAELGDAADAVVRFKTAGHELLRRKRTKEGLKALGEAATLDPSDSELRRFLSEWYLKAGQLDRARSFAVAGHDAGQGTPPGAPAAEYDAPISPVAASATESVRRGQESDHPRAAMSDGSLVAAEDAPLVRAERALRAGRYSEGRAVLDAVVADFGVSRDQLMALGSRLVDADPDAAFVCMDVASDAAAADEGFEAAAATLDAFVRRVPDHVAALMKLIEVSVDGGLDATTYAAQAQLADAYLAADRPADARVIAEDLIAREPWQRANVDRLRRALVALGEAEPDHVIADYLSGASPLALTELWAEASGNRPDKSQSGPPAGLPPGLAAVPPDDGEIELDFVERAEPTVPADAVGSVENVFDTYLDHHSSAPLLDRPFEDLLESLPEEASARPSVECPDEPLPAVLEPEPAAVAEGVGEPASDIVPPVAVPPEEAVPGPELLRESAAVEPTEASLESVGGEPAVTETLVPETVPAEPASVEPTEGEARTAPMSEAEPEPEPVPEPPLTIGDLADLHLAAARELPVESGAGTAADSTTVPADQVESPAAEPPEPTVERPLFDASSAEAAPVLEEDDVASGQGSRLRPATGPDDLDRVFEMFRDEAALRGLYDMGEQHLKLAAAYRDIGMMEECLSALEVAARSPRHRFDAASRLAETLRGLGRTREAVEWFERAAEAPAPGVEDGRRLLYELGKTLTDVGESERALAVFLELQADAPDYRDIAVRVRRLSSAT
jgi:tetratricopeptide (TPR) repeat protein